MAALLSTNQIISAAPSAARQLGHERLIDLLEQLLDMTCSVFFQQDMAKVCAMSACHENVIASVNLKSV